MKHSMPRLLMYIFALGLFSQAAAQNMEMPDYAEKYAFATRNGVWCWFSDPRAIYVDGKIIGGFVDNRGSIWAFSYDPATQQKYQHKLFDKLNYDDHANPSVMALPDKRIVIFFSAHGPSPIYYAVSKRPGDISEWGELNDMSPGTDGNRGFCYTNPVMLSEEGDRVYLFFRGTNFKPNFITTRDLKEWTPPVTVVTPDPGRPTGGRPYMKVASNHKDKIYLAFTDGHPRNEPLNSIYFVMYKGGGIYKANGERIKGSLESVHPSIADVVYDASATHDKAWIWDVAFGRDEAPVIVYARFSDADNSHSYWYARWNGSKWENHRITDAGQWFMRRDYNDKNLTEKENNYSGGVYLDHNDPTIVYTSRPIGNVFEIEKWTFTGDSPKFVSEPVTEESERDNVRPFVVRDYPDGAPNLLWMYNYSYPYFKEFDSAIRVNLKDKGYDPAFTKDAVAKAAGDVFDRQANALRKAPLTGNHARNWYSGVLYIGIFDWAATTEAREGFDFLEKLFDSEHWQVGNRMYHADDLCVGQTSLDMYALFKREQMLIPTKARAEWIIENPPGENIDNTRGRSDRWWWCDALYMAPAVFSRLYAITGEEKYMEFAHREFEATYAQLYDRQEKLFYRDSKFIPGREANGAKIFWSRGNGWVLGGLAELLKTLPEDDAEYRPYYVALFREMSERIAGLQCEDGFWRTSLLDPASYPKPETSGTGLFVSALAYGINSGYLPRDKYLPVVEKGWKALVSAIDTEGKLGWVQPIGSSPNGELSGKSTQLYGVGAFLTAASEIYKMAE
jgi:rhamnogalacturonyl hydrolase YesR